MKSLHETYLRTSAVVVDALGLFRQTSERQLKTIVEAQRDRRVMVALRTIIWIIAGCGLTVSLLAYRSGNGVLGVFLTGISISALTIVVYLWIWRNMSKPDRDL